MGLINATAAPDSRAAAFIETHTAIAASVLVPDIKLYLATDITPLWQATEAFLEQSGIAPPFWAFAWPGSEALAHYITNNPERVAGLRVLDFAAGSGLAGFAALRAGAASVEAAEIDPLAAAAIALNAGLNGLTVDITCADIVNAPCRWDIILCGDVCYEAPMTRHILPWLRCCAAQIPVIIADPSRKYVPTGNRDLIARIQVPTSLDLEDSTSREVVLFRLLPD